MAWLLPPLLLGAALNRPRERLDRVRRALESAPGPARLSLLLGLVAVAGLLLGPAIAFPESWWIERRFALRAEPGRAAPFSDEVVLVALDELFDERYGHPDVTPKAYLARVVRALAAHRPTCIVRDFQFGPSDEADPGCAAFVSAARAADSAGIPLVYPALLGRPGGEVDIVLEPTRALAGTGAAGSVSINVPTAGPGVLPTAPPVLSDIPLLTALGGGRFIPSLALVAVTLQRNPGLLPPGRPVTSVLPDSAAADRLLGELGFDSLHQARLPALVDFPAPPLITFGLAYVSSEHLLEGRAGPDSTLAARLGGRVVVVAKTGASRDGEDVVQTPFGLYRGGIGHVYAVDTLLRGDGLHRPPRWVTALLSALLFVGVSAVWSLRLLHAAALTLAVVFAFVAGGFIAFAFVGALVPMAWPVNAALVAAAVGFLFDPLGGLGAPSGESVPVKSVRAPGPQPRTAPLDPSARALWARRGGRDRS